jgi:uncharacterized protein YybS (DUF2232 family)
VSLTGNPVLQGRILDVVKGSVASATLFLSFLFLPVFGMIPGLFTPLPAIYYAVKQGRVVGLSVVLATAALLAAVGDPTSLIIYLLQAGIMSLALAEFLLRLKGGARSIVYAVAISLTTITAAAALYGYVTGADLHAKVIKGVEASITQTALLYQKSGVGGEELKALNSSMHQAGALIITIYPALVTVALGMMAAANLVLLSRFAVRNRMPVYLGDFRKYRNPEPLIWLLIVAGFGMLIQDSLIHLAALNVLIVLGTLYLMQGLAVMSHFFSTYKVPMFVKVFTCLLLAFQPFMALAVAALGIFDLWGDFRSPDKKQNL